MAVALVLSGIALVGFGAVAGLRGRGRLGAVAGGAVVLLVLAATVSIVAPAVAATSVPSTEITSTPATVGLEYESVTLTTSDGVELAAWYVPGTNRAGVVVMHGAGGLAQRFLELHAQACDARVADPVWLVRWTARFTFEDQDFFVVDPVRYAAVLGDDGVRATLPTRVCCRDASSSRLRSLFSRSLAYRGLLRALG